MSTYTQFLYQLVFGSKGHSFENRIPVCYIAGMLEINPVTLILSEVHSIISILYTYHPQHVRHI